MAGEVLGMKKTLLFLALALAVSMSQAQKVGYLVCTSGIGGVKCRELLSTAAVQEMVELKFPDVRIDVDKQLKHSNYIQILTENSGIYVEKKRVVRKKNGKLKFKRWTGVSS